jgi:hypothetical protein
MRRIQKYNSEHNLYEQIARYLQQQYPDVIYRFDVGADLKLTMGQAAKHKRLHPKRGYPDLFIAEPSTNIWNNPVREWGLHFGLYVEIKKDGEKLNKKDGSWRTPHIAEQAGMLENLRARGYRAEFGVGFDECKQIIDEYLRR